MIVLSHHLGKDCFRIDSDGTSRDWDAARASCQRVVGFGADWGEGKLAVVTPSGPLD